MHLIIFVFVVLMMAQSSSAQTSPVPGATPSHPAAWGEVRVVHAVRSNSPKIDGVFDAEWLQAKPADKFIQRRPVEGAGESSPTRAYVLYDDEALFVCFVCNQTPDSISARVLRRDNSDNCDVAGVYLDTFHDHRNCYYFAVTAAGGQIDGTMSNETTQDDTWDGVWQSAVGRTDSGWIAEMRIPFSSFRHGGERPDGWGFNLVRAINLKQEALFWQPVNNQRGLRVNEFGILLGLKDIGSSRHLEVLPHAVGRWDALQNSKWRSQNQWENLGVYAKYVPTSSWAADFAYQPDFAQVDVDEEVIQLSNYPVFYPEKRPFFLEVGNLFDTSPIQLLYTRRITDPDYVARVYGVSERFRGMVLGGSNRNENGYSQAVGAGRAVWNVGKQSSIGVTGTAMYQKHPLEIFGRTSNGFAALTGATDIRIRWGAENRWSFAGSGSTRTGLYDRPLRLNTASRNTDAIRPFEFRNALYLNLHPLPVKMSLTDDYRGQDYNINDLGWNDYSNTIEHYIWFGNTWQPQKLLLQQWGLDLNGWQRALPDGRYPEGGGNVGLSSATRENFQYGGGWQWGIQNYRAYTGLTSTGEFRDNFFESYGRFDMEPHYYEGGWAWLQTDDRRWLNYYSEGSYGLFREGHKWAWNNSLTLKPRANLETSLVNDWTQVWGARDYNKYLPVTFRIWRWVTRYSPTLNLSFRGTLQWVERGSASYTGWDSNTLLTNLLLAWNWHPGSWFYIVYDEGRITNPLAYNTEGDRTIRVKGTYFFTVK